MRRAYHQLAHVLPTIINLVLIPKGRILLNMNPLTLLPLREVVLLEPRATFHLMRRGNNRAFPQQRLDFRFREVRYHNRPGLPGLDQFLHRFPCI